MGKIFSKQLLSALVTGRWVNGDQDDKSQSYPLMLTMLLMNGGNKEYILVVKKV